MATEDELPEELGKLEITPILPQVKLLDSNLPVQLNPFYENDIKDTGSDSDVAVVEQQAAAAIAAITIRKSQTVNNTRTLKCRRCRYRRASESVLDELKYSSTNAASDIEQNCMKTPPNGVLKQTLKKSTSSSVGGLGNRKIILREPILKALQTCLQPQFHSSVLYSSLAADNDGPLTAKGISDFRDLIDECRNLLSEDVDFSGRLNQISLSNRNSKNFTTMQTSKIQNNNKTRNTRRPTILNNPTLAAPSPEKTALNENHLDAHVMPLLQPSQLGSSITSTNLQPRNSSPEHNSNHARCSTTCSQQAGNSATASSCDDVTIDELASYFDTFVHIPKKMSSMAEMMYI